MSPSEDAPKDPLDEVVDFRIGLVKTRFDGSEVDLGTAVWDRAAVHPRRLVYEWVPPTVEEADEPGARFTAWAEVVLPERNVRVETEFWFGSGQDLADELWLRLLHPLPKGRPTFPPQGVTALLNEALERCEFLEITYDVDPHEKTPYEVELNRHGGPFVRRRGVTLDEALVLCLVPWRESETAREDPAPEVEDPAEFLRRLQSVLERTAYVGFDYAPGRGERAFEITVTRNDQCVAVGEGPTLKGALAAAELRLSELQDWNPDFRK